MKKLLAMVLALVMTLSLAVSASAVKADEKINEDYAEAVAVLNGMGVFKGYRLIHGCAAGRSSWRTRRSKAGARQRTHGLPERSSVAAAGTRL